MTALPSKSASISKVRVGRLQRDIVSAQNLIYQFLLRIVRRWKPEDVLVEFQRLFIHQVNTTSSDTVPALYEIVFANQEQEFCNTLKRSCYILINNWEISRQFSYIYELIDLFSDATIDRPTLSPTSRRLRQWLQRFVNSQDFEEIKLFAHRYDEAEPKPWSQRYASYLLVPQYANLSNPIEQREAARSLSFRLREKFKFDLAFYTAHSQSSLKSTIDRQIDGQNEPRNPTILGDEVLWLIKLIVARRGQFSYTHLAHIFLEQTKDMRYRAFKKSLIKYLLFSMSDRSIKEQFETQLSSRLGELYESHDRRRLDDALLLRTCNRVIDWLTSEDGEQPATLFVLTLSHGNPLILVTVLLKLVLSCNYSRVHLESRIASLIRYYAALPEDDCRWVLNFLEVFRITMTIHAENIEYNLVTSSAPSPVLKLGKTRFDNYRIFSQAKRHHEFDDDQMLEKIAQLDAIAADSESVTEFNESARDERLNA